MPRVAISNSACAGAPAEVEPAMADIRRGIQALGGRMEENAK